MRKLDFCDVLIKPKSSSVTSRKNVAINRKFVTKHAKIILDCIPVVCANMTVVATEPMIKKFKNLNCLVAVHKFYNEETLIRLFDQFESTLFFTTGFDLTKLKYVSKYTKINKICLDVANGYINRFLDVVKEIRQLFPKSVIMAGNVCTKDVVADIVHSGADIVKIGIGSGSVCKTRMITGVGYPQLSAIVETNKKIHKLDALLCSDGGCKTPADVVKAFAAGADFTMIGGMLAGTKECSGDVVDDCIRFYGMASKDAMDQFHGGIPDYKTSEGATELVKIKNCSAEDVLKEIFGGIRSACSYVGSNTLENLAENTSFIKVNRTHHKDI